MYRCVLILVHFVAICTNRVIAAQVIFFDDKASFDAVTTTTTIDFEGLAPGNGFFPPPPLNDTQLLTVDLLVHEGLGAHGLMSRDLTHTYDSKTGRLDSLSRPFDCLAHLCRSRAAGVVPGRQRSVQTEHIVNVVFDGRVELVQIFERDLR